MMQHNPNLTVPPMSSGPVPNISGGGYTTYPSPSAPVPAGSMIGRGTALYGGDLDFITQSVDVEIKESVVGLFTIKRILEAFIKKVFKLQVKITMTRSSANSITTLHINFSDEDLCSLSPKMLGETNEEE